jgi:glycosyltransferase involved in cell wall biosynthesis
MGFAQDMRNLLKLVKNMTHCKNAHFLFIGDGDQRDLVEKAAVELPNLTFHPSVNQQKFEKILTKVDIGLFSLSADHTTHNFPGKLLGYMVNGIPILGSINKGNDLKKILESYGAGKAFVNGNDADLKDAAEFLLHNYSYRKNMGLQGKKLSKDLFSVHNAADKIVNSYFKWKQSN